MKRIVLVFWGALFGVSHSLASGAGEMNTTLGNKIVISGEVVPGVELWLAKTTPNPGTDSGFTSSLIKILTDKNGIYVTPSLDDSGVYALTPRKCGVTFEPPMAIFNLKQKKIYKKINFKAVELHPSPVCGV